MANTNDKTIALTAGTFILLSLLVSGAYFIQPQDANSTYICNATQLVSICEKLSVDNSRCYFNVTHYKTCSSKWVQYTPEIPVVPVVIPTNSSSLCYSDDTYTYCCESSKLASKGSCDFIVRRNR